MSDCGLCGRIRNDLAAEILGICYSCYQIMTIYYESDNSAYADLTIYEFYEKLTGKPPATYEDPYTRYIPK